MARSLSQRHERFAHVPQIPCVYLAELSNGVIKVGYSRSARKRLIGLSLRVQTIFETDIERFQVQTMPSGRDAYLRERVLIERLAGAATPLPQRAEYFDGITFDAALKLFLSA